MEIKGIKLTVKDYIATETQTPALVDLGLILEITTADGKVIQKNLCFEDGNEYDVTDQPITIKLQMKLKIHADLKKQAEIVYDQEETDFKATNGHNEYGNNFRYLGGSDSIIVIGNIYQNPELLEVNK